jgi:hypothetical protein
LVPGDDWQSVQLMHSGSLAGGAVPRPAFMTAYWIDGVGEHPDVTIGQTTIQG